MTIEITDLLVDRTTSLKTAMERIDQNGRGIVFIVDDGELVGTTTDGDIRRGILDGIDLDAPVESVANRDPIVVHEDWSTEERKRRVRTSSLDEILGEYGCLTVPVLNDDGEVKDVTLLDGQGTTVNGARTTNGSVGTVLVIGGAGYIGSVLCRQLLERGISVKVLDKLIYGDRGVTPLDDDDRFTLLEGDMRAIDDVMEAMAGVDAVVHLGALVGDPASALDTRTTLELNYHSVKLAAHLCKYHQVNRFVFASTCSVYGESEAGDLLTEESPLNPVSLYAKTKIESERALLDMADGTFSPTCLRMATIYGLSPRMRFDLVVNVLTAKATHENVVPIFGGDQYRPNVHVADAARAFIACLEAPIDDVAAEVFNVGSSDQNYRIAELGRIVADCVPDAEIEWHPENEDDRSYRVDFSKIGDVLDYDVSRTVADGCREIHSALRDGEFDDYTEARYSNYKTLEESIDGLGAPRAG